MMHNTIALAAMVSATFYAAAMIVYMRLAR
jgi:hypothetical protein